MDHAQFHDWWKTLVSALRLLSPCPSTTRNNVGKQLPEVLGVDFDRTCKESWFFQHEVVF